MDTISKFGIGVCPSCGKTFQKRWNTSKYCSDACRERPSLALTCVSCGGVFIATRRQGRRPSRCPDCKSPRVTFICARCGDEFPRTGTRGRFPTVCPPCVTRKPAPAADTRPRSALELELDEETRICRAIRIKYNVRVLGPRREFSKRIRDSVLGRDSGTCACGEPGVEVHHIQPLHLGGDNDLTNLITLCWSCHRAAHAHIRQAVS
jgi:5-methylcytosine-specific restriction endonuclease McrA